MDFDHQIFSTVIFSLPLIQEKLMSVSSESMVNRVGGLSLPKDSVAVPTLTMGTWQQQRPPTPLERNEAKMKLALLLPEIVHIHLNFKGVYLNTDQTIVEFISN